MIEFEIVSFGVVLGLILWNLKLTREHCRELAEIKAKLKA